MLNACFRPIVRRPMRCGSVWHANFAERALNGIRCIVCSQYQHTLPAVDSSTFVLHAVVLAVYDGNSFRIYEQLNCG